MRARQLLDGSAPGFPAETMDAVNHAFANACLGADSPSLHRRQSERGSQIKIGGVRLGCDQARFNGCRRDRKSRAWHVQISKTTHKKLTENSLHPTHK